MFQHKVTVRHITVFNHAAYASHKIRMRPPKIEKDFHQPSHLLLLQRCAPLTSSSFFPSAFSATRSVPPPGWSGRRYLIMEFCCGGELFDYIVAQNRVKESEADRERCGEVNGGVGDGSPDDPDDRFVARRKARTGGAGSLPGCRPNLSGRGWAGSLRKTDLTAKQFPTGS